MKRKSQITQTHRAVRIDNELMEFVDAQPNKNRMINVAIKEFKERGEVRNGSNRP